MTAPYRLVLPASADRTAWLKERRGGLGSSDIPQIMGVASRGSAQHVYYDKRGETALEDDAGEAALWGSLDEETTAREWARRNRATVRRIGLIARRDADHHRCTLDRLVHECPLSRDRAEVCALEVKHRNAWVAGKWKRTVPDDVLAQVLWQLWVTGMDHIHVACRIGGNDFRQYVIKAADNTQVIADIVTVADRLWADIQAGRVPALTGDEHPDSVLDLQDRLYPERSGVAHLDEYPALAVATTEDLLAYEIARLKEAEAKKEKEAAKLRLIDRLKGAEIGLLHGEMAFMFSDVKADGEKSTRSHVDMDALAERHPDAYADCVVDKPVRRITIAKSRRLKELPA